MKSVLVTGGAGFIGSHLVELLVREGFQVRTFVHYNSQGKWHHLENVSEEIRSAIEIIPGDIADGGAVAKAVAGCEWVFHLAALIGIPYSYVAPASYVQTNIIGTLNVLEACRNHGVARMLHTSTSETYGSAQYVPIDEKHPMVGQSPYSATKIGADKLAESYWLSFEMPTTIVRPFNTYGPRQSKRAIIPTVMTQAISGNELKLGNLDPIRDLTFVTDTAAGFLAAARSEKVIGKTVNLGVGSGISIRELVGKIGRIAGRDFHVELQDQRVRPEGSEVQRLISDNRLAKELMEWEPKVNLDQGLRATFKHIQDHPLDYPNRGYVV
jgi:NAD dependent epimerase/dehydratase